MRKIVFLAVFASMVSAAVAQDNMMSKKGTPILPEAGDWSIGIDAVPFIDWAFDKTRIMSTSGVTSAGSAVSAQMPMTLVGLYMKDADMAYRAKVGINFASHSEDHIIYANITNSTGTAPSTPVYVTDNIKTSSMGITLGAGIQKFRGKGRLKGIYGAEAMIGFSGGTKTTYAYGNSFILAPDTAFYQGQANVYSSTAPGNEAYVSSRTTENKTGSMFSFGVDGFVGVEYFMLAKMSVSAEYNWGISISSHGEGETTSEMTVAPVSPSTSFTTKTQTVKSGKSSDFNVGNGDINTSNTGSIVFHFYF